MSEPTEREWLEGLHPDAQQEAELRAKAEAIVGALLDPSSDIALAAWLAEHTEEQT
jgi:hypothetical protein